MLRKTIKSMRRRRVGPVGLSVAAAALTAVAFAAVSVAKDDGSRGEEARHGGDEVLFEHRVGPPRMEDLSDEERQALEDFKQCMEDQGAPAPPSPGDFEEGERPEPPSEADREAIHKALEACRDELPEGVHHFGPGGPCGPPPGARGEGAAIPVPPPSNGNES
jgi:hypothetical protein